MDPYQGEKLNPQRCHSVHFCNLKEHLDSKNSFYIRFDKQMDSITQFKKTKATFYLDCTILSVQQLFFCAIKCAKGASYISACADMHTAYRPASKC